MRGKDCNEMLFPFEECTHLRVTALQELKGS